MLLRGARGIYVNDLAATLETYVLMFRRLSCYAKPFQRRYIHASNVRLPSTEMKIDIIEGIYDTLMQS